MQRNEPLGAGTPERTALYIVCAVTSTLLFYWSVQVLVSLILAEAVLPIEAYGVRMVLIFKMLCALVVGAVSVVVGLIGVRRLLRLPRCPCKTH